MRLTEQSKRAIEAAAVAARRAGASSAGPGHLLQGLAEVEGGARHELAGLAGPPVAPGGELRTAIEAAARHAQAAGRDRVATADLLAGLLGTTVGEHAGCCPEVVGSFVEPVLAEVTARAGAVPRRGWVGTLGVLLPFWLLLYGLLLAVTWDTSGPEIVVAGAAGSMFIALVVAPVQILRRRREVTVRSLALVPLPADAGVLLGRLGLRELEVHLQAGIGSDRCLWLGRKAVILLTEHTDGDLERARFVLWHEIAHLARRDSLAWTVTGLLGVGALIGAMLSFDPRALGLTLLAVPVLTVAGRWWGEAACDRFAVRQAGAGALRAWAVHLRTLVASARRTNPAARRSRVRALVTHPPLTLRMALHQR
ncbi:hypothetical protein [Dactylosporangium sp. CS-033363]|uniref:hypothetical protein n=1 Tax=Dactylosporangium sp. CS-033363 TaxID=3239935 RepID=UPI003D9451E6